MLPLFTLTIFLGAALLFLVQPMVARLILPQLGGSPAVWNTCLVFFQTALLAGYLYAHALGRARNARAARLLHAAAILAPLALLPLHLPSGRADLMTQHPAAWLLLMLTLGIAAPFVLMSTSASLLQRWFASTDHPAAKDPYFLYAASNAGSLVGLLAYPALVEPSLTLTHQRWLWSAGYIAWALLVIACGITSARRAAAPEPAATPPPDAASTPPPATNSPQALWLLLAFAPSSLLLGVTTFLSTDLAAVPFLWVLPLAIYLITFIIAFAPRCAIVITPARWTFIALAAGLAIAWLSNTRLPLLASFALHLGLLLTGGIACHGRLAQLRPPPSGLTGFYLVMSIGGALGGMFNALAAPLLFSITAEYPLALGLVCLLTFPLAPARPALARLAPGALAGTAIAASLLWSLSTIGQGARIIRQERTFFGIHRVIDTDGGWRLLTHGVTIHGREHSGNLGKPTGYYHPSGPLAQVMLFSNTTPPWRDVAVVGLGTGGLAAYARGPDQRTTFYEIDPAVIRIAGDKSLFTFVSSSRAKVSAVLGDARRTLALEPEGRFDLIILDAFSSDAIPVHLITREAIELYLSRLAPNGIIALHLSNRYLDLPPIAAAAARSLNLVALLRIDPSSAITPQQRAEGKSGSTVVVLARGPDELRPLASDPRWSRIDQTATARVWTDDYSNVLGALNIRR